MRILRYFYLYGFAALIRRCFDRSYHPRTMGFGYLFCHGIHRVGTLWAIPTLKSFRVWRMLRGARKIDIVLTLMWGGGSAAYVDGLIQRKATGEWTIEVKPTGAMGRLSLTLWNGRERMLAFEIESLKVLYGLRGRCNEIVVNHLIQWHYFVRAGLFDVNDYGMVIDDVLRLRQFVRAKMVFMVHDYFSICPRFTLTMDEPRYCNSEYSCESCATCLGTNERAGLAFKPGLDIYKWRQIWRKLLDECDEVRTFSDDTLYRMRQIFPELKLTMIPHQPVVKFSRIPNVQKRRLVIGVFGNVFDNKGSGVVIDVVRLIRKRKLNEELVIIGDFIPPKGMDSPDDLVVTGAYEPASLVDLIEKYGVNLALFPSIGPETFSYVTQELMELRLPIVCFNIGAPKDRVRAYDLGWVCDEISAESALEGIHLLALKVGVNV